MGVIWHSRDSKMVAGDAEIDPCPGCTIERLRAEIERLKSERENVECEECGFEYHSRHFEEGRPCPVCEVERLHSKARIESEYGARLFQSNGRLTIVIFIVSAVLIVQSLCNLMT